MNKINILGVKIDSLTQVQVLEKVESFFGPEAYRPLAGTVQFLTVSRGRQIITANPEIVLEVWHNEKYRNLINNAALVISDGIGLLWAAKFLSLPSKSLITSLMQALASVASLIFYPDYCRGVLPERIAGVDLMEKICEKAGAQNRKVYLLGAETGVAEKTAGILKNRYLNLRIVGAEQGIAEYQAGTLDNELISRINSTDPDILFVAFGAPKQDFFIQEYLPKLPTVKLAMGVGGSFDFISGKVKRAPQIYRDLGLEWFYRFYNEPWRALRIFNATVRFMVSVVKYKHLVKN